MKKMFHRNKDNKAEKSPVRDTHHSSNSTLNSQSNDFHIHGGEKQAFVVQGGQPLSYDRVGGSNVHSGSYTTSSSSYTESRPTYTESYTTSSRPVDYVERRDITYTESRPTYVERDVTYTESRPVDYHRENVSYTTASNETLGQLGHVSALNQPLVSGLGMGQPTTSEYLHTTDSHSFNSHQTSGSNAGATIEKIKNVVTKVSAVITPENIEKVHQVLNKGREMAAKIPQPKDVNVDHDKLGMPIQRAGETYQTGAVKVVHALHEQTHKLDAKLEALETKLSDPREMERHHERAMKIGSTIQTQLDKAQSVVDKVQMVQERIEGKVRKTGLSPTTIRHQAFTQATELSKAGAKGGSMGVAKNIATQVIKSKLNSHKTESSRLDSNRVESNRVESSRVVETFDKENFAPNLLPRDTVTTNIAPVKVETTIETKIIEQPAAINTVFTNNTHSNVLGQNNHGQF